MIIPEKFTKPYDPKTTETKVYELWLEKNCFNPDYQTDTSGFFSVVLPPPNVTGTLHTGHALMIAIQDIAVRYHRMLGKKTLWLPGTDHAAIATQSKVEKLLEKEGLKKRDLGREEFLKRVDKFAQESHDTIVNQTKKMGASLDWSREAFTLDKTRHKAVYLAFKQFYDLGVIYRKERIVNWDPKGQTVISDDEIVYVERPAKLYTFKYHSDCPIEIATTRPETKLGDTAIAVHPSSKWKEYIGQTFEFNFAGESVSVKVIADEAVDPEFGTGALGVTPAHSTIDWEIAERHNLPIKQVINEYGKMLVGIEGVKGEKTENARIAVVSWLKEKGLLIKEEDIMQNVSTAERSGAVIEPMPKLQWWIDVKKPAFDGKSLKDLMIEAVTVDGIKILPDRFEKVYFNWINNLRDWCISRQIWYGHRIPVWYKDNESYCDTEAPKETGWVQEEDTLDTWFSSGLWTFSTLLDEKNYQPSLKKWLESSPDKVYHPNSLMETGHDIIFFWVARMILMTKGLIGEIPFKQVYFHGMVRNKDGQKMSKSLGNAASDPLEIIEKYGADALRMALVVGNGPGQDIKLAEEKIKAYGKFANKLWNITRFVLENTADYDFASHSQEHADQAIISNLDTLIREVTTEMDSFKFYLVSEKLYHYIWHQFADVIIESMKPKLQEKSSVDRKKAQATLWEVFLTTLKMLHPFMPFVTEEIWQSLPFQASESALISNKWPQTLKN